MIMGFVLVIVVSGGLLSLGPSLEPRGGRGRRATSSRRARPTRRSTSIAGPGTKFSADAFDTVYTTTAGIIEIDYTGADRVTPCVFTDPKLAGFELETAEQGEGQGRADARRVHHLLQRPRPPRRRHAGDARPSRDVSVAWYAAARRRSRSRSCSSRAAAAAVATAERQAYEEPSQPAQETLTLESGNFYFKPDNADVSTGVVNLELDNVRAASTRWCSTTARCPASSSR